MKNCAYIFIVIFSILGCSTRSPKEVPLTVIANKLNNPEHYIAGQPIKINFKLDKPYKPQLLIENAFGSSILTGLAQGLHISYDIPEIYTQKSGNLHWRLLGTDKVLLEGKLDIKPSPIEKPLLEAYLGPPSLMAGNRDFADIVILPVDQFDNPLAKGSKIRVQEQAGKLMHTDTLVLDKLMAWKRIYSREKTGKLLHGAHTLGGRSKEMTASIYPSNPVDFLITASMTHAYADGNQMISFSTSKLVDQFNNTISDGTQVHFSIETGNGQILSSWAAVVEGVATAKLLHPEASDEWKITAFISGAAMSNTLKIKFLPAFSDFSINVSKKDNEISVGPIHSFLGQWIPDGFPVEFKLFNQGKLFHEHSTNTRNGMGYFTLNNEIPFQKGMTLEISAGGVTKIHQLQFNE